MKYLKYVLLGLAVVGISSWFMFSDKKPDVALGMVNEEVTYSSATATSTLTYITTATATTTSAVIPIPESKSADIIICATASSSAATLLTKHWFAYTLGTNPTWTEETSETVNSANVSTFAPVNYHSLSLATTTENHRCFNLGITPTRAKLMRVDYQVVGANTGIWVSGVAQKEQ